MLAICEGLRSLADACVLDLPPILPVTESLVGLVPSADALFLASSEALDRKVLGVGRFVEAGLWVAGLVVDGSLTGAGGDSSRTELNLLTRACISCLAREEEEEDEELFGRGADFSIVGDGVVRLSMDLFHLAETGVVL